MFLFKIKIEYTILTLPAGDRAVISKVTRAKQTFIHAFIVE